MKVLKIRLNNHLLSTDYLSIAVSNLKDIAMPLEKLTTKKREIQKQRVQVMMMGLAEKASARGAPVVILRK